MGILLSVWTDNMERPSLSREQLQKVLAETPAPDALYEILSLYEDEACQQFAQTGITGDEKLLSAFYSSFLFSHLLIDEMWVVSQACEGTAVLTKSSQEARALTHRMPPTMIASDSAIQNSISVLRAIWQNKYSETYKLMRNQPWPEPVNIIVHRFDG